MIQVTATVLEGLVVRLEPVGLQHAADLAEVAELDLFKWFLGNIPTEQSESDLGRVIEQACSVSNQLMFAVVLQSTGKAVGSTSYLDIRQEHAGLEIGATWYSRAFQGTAVNPECKLLLMTHAFEVLGCERVQLKTDARNLRSQAAIAKLGAVREGCLRKHGRMPDGFLRDTVFYSVIAEEWPKVKAGLVSRIPHSE